MNCWATHSYWPLCALNPWEMTTTACGLPVGCHSRVKILRPSTPLKLPSVIVDLLIQTLRGKAVQGRPTTHGSHCPGPKSSSALAVCSCTDCGVIGAVT